MIALYDTHGLGYCPRRQGGPRHAIAPHAEGRDPTRKVEPAMSLARPVVSFRDADEPRPLAARLIAAARQHGRGWSVNISPGRSIECATFDGAVEAVTNASGVHRLLILWTLTDPNISPEHRTPEIPEGDR
jgi:hypothetical protein